MPKVTGPFIAQFVLKKKWKAKLITALWG